MFLFCLRTRWISGLNPLFIWFDPETQLQRLMTRDGSMEEAKSRINAQMSLDLKRSKADIVIDNTSSLEALHEQFQKVLTEITKPLTCIEFMLSRNGAFLALFSTFVSVAIFKKSS
ncbi:Dephospho-CoA kinase [Capsicum annuum]|uniref:Dephospho-CoA kinase n=1 Tax=Capsicum annuum TaxID=4072 RepID=A0A2G2ZNK8_CAPAN|nr:Dephospho-CoA kinase [Capsicum annuum]PHT83563.1 Dephospho-CoA kinase [Capsicum annuum]